MAEMRGMQMPEPSSGSGGRGITDAIMGIFRERKKSQRALEMMAYQSAMNVAGHVAKTKLGAEALSDVDVEHTKKIFNPATWGEEEWAQEAGKVRQKQYAEAGIRDISGGKISYQSRGTVGYTPTAGKSKKKQDVNKVVKKTVPGETPTVNDQPQTVAPANTGNRKPKASKGGFKGAGVPMPTFTGASTPSAPGTSTPVAPAKPAVRRPRAPRAGRSNIGTGQTPTTPPMGGMNA
ncbi:MAG: hypothetical protein ACO3FO_04720 [Candidatus Nanopelagicaceae bacterium]